MPAVTVATGYPYKNVNGSFREYYYRVNIAANGDTLDVPLPRVVCVNMNDNALTAVGVTVTALAPRRSRLTFACGGAITNCYVRVTGW